ncbi:hypothetical protein [Nocardioides sp.]|uniref:hypothetical protein n=1 Tax=Nocardioides sp. TaxID=35761 RepID=UPI001A2A9AFC|nr:hypothetical protein [Nocardioides sp.]MBJ7359347.1 hypothetical protein [Nocardioides sp.]
MTSRAQELRANLGARQVAETLLAEAGKIRQDAALAADALVEEAQQLSEQLVAESRRAAEQVTAEAREEAKAVLSRARTEAEELAAQARANAEALRSAAEAEIEEHRRRVRAEVTALVTRELTEQHRAAEAAAREESEAVVSDLEASVRILGVSLETALGNVSELLGSLEALRPTDTRTTSRPDEVPPEQQPPASRTGGAHLVDTPFGLEPLGAATSSVPSASSPFGTEVDPADPGDLGRPRSATEAFLSSSSLEIEQASRELRDLQHPEEARRRRGDESKLAAQRRELDTDAATDGLTDEEQEPGDEAARPLGWLFRTAH